ncbi:MAG: protein kinase [Planctomycetota bacterium]
MSTSGAEPAGTERRERIRRVCADCAQRRAQGEPVSDTEVIAAHADLLPELADELRRLTTPHTATTTAAGTSGGGAADFDSANIETAPPVPADAFPGYQLVREISRGGQGVVYEAIQAHTRRKVAIKVLHGGATASDAARLRFEREMQLAAQLQHPQVVSIFHCGITPDGRQYCVMDYVHGVPAQRYVRDHKLTLEDALALFATICDAVQFAHEHGIVHRDLKPSNILVDADGQPHILDFGLAKSLAGPADATPSLTQDMVGTLPYMSPEQVLGGAGELDARTDVYALGVLLYELLTGHFPYPVSGRMADVLRHIAQSPPAPLSRQWDSASGITQRAGRIRHPGGCPLDRELQTIVLKALAKERQRRYRTAGALRDDIRRYLSGEPILGRRDSLTYLAWARGRRALRRRPVLTALCGFAAIALATQYVVAPLVYRWSSFNWRYETLLMRHASPPPWTDFEHVRLIELTDRTDVAALARAAGLADVTAENLPSLRRLHGALLERLAASGLRVFVSDIRFASPSEFDDDLVRGIKAVKQRGTDVIVCTRDWKVNEQGLPELTPALLPDVRWAAATGDFSAERAWSLDLLVERLGQDALPSLALLAAAAHRQPGANVLILVDARHTQVLLRPWKSPPAAPQAKQWLAGGPPVQLTGRWPLPQDDDDYGLRRGDMVGHYLVVIPPDEVLSRARVEYQDAFLADAAQLRAWFGGRVVVLGDTRREVDRYPHPDGRLVAGCHAHATAIEGLLRTAALRAPSDPDTWVIVGLAMAAGGGTGWLLYRRPARCAVTLAVLALASVAILVVAYRSAGYLVNPLVPISALAASGAFAAVARRVRSAGLAAPGWEVTT